MSRRTLSWLACGSLLALAVAAVAEDRVLYEKDSPYNTIIVTESVTGLRTLRFERGGARQSVIKPGDPDHLELPYARVVPVGLACVAKPQRVLIVGLGGGSIPMFLRKHFSQMEIDVVDIDPDVVAVAKRFFEFQEDDKLHAYVEDGRTFIEKRPNRYDVIFLDAFGSESVPYHLTTREFLQAVRASLRPGGAVVGNIWSRPSNTLHDAMLITYQAVFPELCLVDVPGAGNRILIALHGKLGLTRDSLAQRARTVSQQNRFGYDLGKLVTSGFRILAEEGLQGPVLRDKIPQRKAG